MRTSRGGFGGMLLSGLFLATSGWLQPAAGADDIDQLLRLEDTLAQSQDSVRTASPTPDAATETNDAAPATAAEEEAPISGPAAGGELTAAVETVEPAAVEIVPGQGEAIGESATSVESAADEPVPGQGEAISEAVIAIQRLKASNADFQQALALKEEQMKEANIEIAHLKDVVRRIWEANKRERVNSLYNMGCAYKACRLYKDAEKQFLKALEIEPSDAGVHYNLAILYDDDLKNKANARTHYKQFLELAPSDKDAPRAREWLLSAETAP